MKLSKKELKEDFKKIPTTRHRLYVDQRSYIIGALYYGCGMTEHEIATYLEIVRDTVNYNKYNAVRLKDDEVFMYNTEDLRLKHPYKSGNVIMKARSRKDKYVLTFSLKDLTKLNKFHKKKGFPSVVHTIKYLVRNGIKANDVWEK